ncbi:unnamed protein product [Diabrotica balteata]|uniref:Uncharacterized protein n=1 Tax=Diabrotica balteata TaxID=107213 RepID=A0A9N9T1D7_DIABA|nr:unnamed protein product [Diabrotica balteata]
MDDQSNINEQPCTQDRNNDFITFLEKLRPEITVSRFVSVNRNLLPKLLSTIATYAIVLIQLNSMVL